MKTLFILLSLFFTTTVVAQNDDSCNLECHKQAPCELGDADFSNHSSYDDGSQLSFHVGANINGMHCACPHGWTGITCDRVYNTCDGHHKCYNGGTCLPGLMDYYGNEQLFCDCSQALDEDGLPFVGKFCEHMTETDCGSEGVYCVNGGECNPDFPEGGSKPCLCSDDFDGPHCEFKATENVPTCDLQCQNGGDCQLGYTTPSKEFHDIDNLYETDTDTAQDYMTCVCPPSWGGKMCEVVKYECGSHQCYHGGICISRTDGDGTPKYHCDCSTAETDSDSYAGRFCQYESTSFCTKQDNQNGHLFCVNGGICNGDGVESCACPAEFYGPSCEFKKLPTPPMATQPPITDDPNNNIDNPPPTNHPAPVPINLNEHGQHLNNLDACDLKCDNDGDCRKGSKDLGVISHLASHLAELNQTSNVNFEHCVCPPGFVGLRCEHKMEICPSGEHVCLHGSKCVKFGDEHGCDCSAQTNHVLSGDSCQHKNTVMCTEGELQPVQPRSFCVNGGSCKSMVSGTEIHVPCVCSDEFVGPHCELHKETAQQQTQLSEVGDSEEPVSVIAMNNEGSSSLMVAVLVIGILALVASVVISTGTYVRNKNHRLRVDQEHKLTMALATHHHSLQENHSGMDLWPVANANLARGEPEVYLGPPRDEDGHELHNVEII